ncbi:MAG: hypothetical protein ACLPI9_02130 [Halobacteriota archaeon]
MSLILTFPSSSASTSSVMSTTSAIALNDILTGAVIAIGALFFVLVLNYVMSPLDSWNADTATAMRAISAPLIVTFFAFIVYNVLHLL